MYLYWPMRVSSAANRVVEAANDLRVVVPLAQHDSLDRLVMYIKEQNLSQGPGFRLAGVVLTPSTFWRLALTIVTLVLGAVANTI